jgi:hypothetical protein
MIPWWHNLDSLIAINGWVQIIAVLGGLATIVSILFLWSYGNKMISLLIVREQKASQKIAAVEKAAEQIRKELLSTQQNQDIADQRRHLAEMDADSLRNELEHTRKRYSQAETALKDRIGELKNLNITQGLTTTTPAGVQTAPTAAISNAVLDAQQKKMLAKLLASGPKGELDIIAVLDNAQSFEMAKELKKILDQHGWATRDIVQSAFSNPPEGMVLVIHSKQTAPSYAKFLQKTMTTLGMKVSAQINDKYPEWSISLIVGQLDA